MSNTRRKMSAAKVITQHPPQVPRGEPQRCASENEARRDRADRSENRMEVKELGVRVGAGGLDRVTHRFR